MSELDQERSLRAESLDQQRQIYELLIEHASSKKLLRNLGVTAFTAVGVASAEIRILANEYKILIAGGAVALAATIGTKWELDSRRNRRDAHERAEMALEIAQLDPPLPVPKWVKQELDIES